MYKIGITGLNAGDSPAPGVPVARCLMEHPGWSGKICGLAYDTLESGGMDRQLVSSVYLLPYPKAGRNALLERLSYIQEQEGLDVIIPNLDAELPNFIPLRDELATMGIRMFLPSEEQFKRRSKVNLQKLADEIGINTPKTRLVTDPNHIDVRQDELPVMVKGLFYDAKMAYTLEEVHHHVHAIASMWGYPVLIQQFIEGEEYNAAAVGDGTGKLLAVAGMKKLVFTDKGKGWACVSIINEGLNQLAEKIVSALAWPGAMEVEAIKSKKDGKFYLIELNPRFPAWIYLAKAAGMNLPHLYLQLALGIESSEKMEYRSGVVFTNYTTNLITDLDRISTLFTDGEVCYEETI
jgi:carbamoyl-phosphate synthase large subunit